MRRMQGNQLISIDHEHRLLLREINRRKGVLALASNRFTGFTLTGDIAPRAIEQTFAELVVRHESLRSVALANPDIPGTEREARITRFDRTRLFLPGLYVQRIDSTKPFEMRVDDLSRQADSLKQRAIHEMLVGESQRHFMPAKEALIRVRLSKLSEYEHLLLVILDRSICDSGCFPVIHAEFLSLYASVTNRSKMPASERPAAAYVDFAEWQHQAMSSSYFNQAVRFWRQEWVRYASSRIPLESFPLASRGSSASGSVKIARFSLGAIESAGMVEFCAQRQCGMEAVFLGVYFGALSHLTGLSRLALWCRFPNRTRQETSTVLASVSTRHLIGIDLGNKVSIAEFLQLVDAKLRLASIHQEMPLQHLWNTLECYPRIEAADLDFEFCNIQSDENLSETEKPTVRATDLSYEATASPNGLSLIIRVDHKRISVSAHYNTKLYSDEGVHAFIERLSYLINRVVSSSHLDIWRFFEIDRSLKRYEKTLATPLSEFLLTNPTSIPRKRVTHETGEPIPAIRELGCSAEGRTLA